MIRPTIGTALLVLASGALGACGSTVTPTYTRHENHKTIEVDKQSKRVWLKKSYTIDSLSVDPERGRLEGRVVEHLDTANETSSGTVAEYDLVTRSRRQLYVIEYQVKSVSARPVRVIILPGGLVFGLLALPYEIAVGHGQSEKSFVDYSNWVDTGEVSRERRKEKQPGRTIGHSDHETVHGPARSIPVVLESALIGLGGGGDGKIVVQTDAEGEFSIPIVLPDSLGSAAEASRRALDALNGVFLTERQARDFLGSVRFQQKASAGISARTDAKSLYDVNLKGRITDDSRNVGVSGVGVSREAILKALDAHLRGIADGAAHADIATITIAVKDSISRVGLDGAGLETRLVVGVTEAQLRAQVLQELRRHVTPAYAAKYARGAALPEILTLPRSVGVGRSRSFTIHVPATYDLQVTHPDYVYIEGQKEFTAHETSAVVYMEEKGSKHRVETDTRPDKGRIE